MASHRLRGNSNITLVFLDTNAIFMIFEFNIDLENELTKLVGLNSIKIPEAVVNEIRIILTKGKGKQRLLAKPALDFIKRYPVLSHQSFSNADDALVQLAIDHHGVVVTNDKELRDRLKHNQISTVFLRAKNQLVFER